MAEQQKVTQANQVDTVLQDYLDQLLVAATLVSEVKAEVKVTPPVSETIVQQEVVATAVTPPVMTAPVSTRPAVTAPTLTAELLVPPLVPAETVIEEPAVETPVDDVESVNISSVSSGGSHPPQTLSLNWRSRQGIDCLIFKVAGLKLAIPLPLLGGVHNVADKVTPLFGQAVWSLGVWQGEAGKLTIIDSAQLIMPERGIRLADEGYQFFIQLDRSPWALACQEICDTVTLVHDSIKWRGDGSKRPWLAGTVISEMCALLDVPGILKLLNDNTRVRAHS